MREKPILFSGPMVRAILDGSKTQTRRVIKAEINLVGPTPYYASKPGAVRCPYGQPGGRLWVRETWSASLDTDGDMCEPILYRASYDETVSGPLKATFSDRATEIWDTVGNTGWRPSIHMPRWASRIALELTDVRVERVQDISEADAQAEGIRPWDDTPGWPRIAFSQLWDEINAKRGYGWDTNPWVWALTFRRVEP